LLDLKLDILKNSSRQLYAFCIFRQENIER